MKMLLWTLPLLVATQAHAVPCTLSDAKDFSGIYASPSAVECWDSRGELCDLIKNAKAATLQLEKLHTSGNNALAVYLNQNGENTAMVRFELENQTLSPTCYYEDNKKIMEFSIEGVDYLERLTLEDGIVTYRHSQPGDLVFEIRLGSRE